eukprot:Sspe_Gene.75122::Locus_46943_Transcript_2_2_Confidence_0.750_Length_2551::g.75122::m.75122/K19801/PI4KB; phosphatidylinositol 4-kinase B
MPSMSSEVKALAWGACGALSVHAVIIASRHPRKDVKWAHLAAGLAAVLTINHFRSTLKKKFKESRSKAYLDKKKRELVVKCSTVKKKAWKKAAKVLNAEDEDSIEIGIFSSLDSQLYSGELTGRDMELLLPQLLNTLLYPPRAKVMIAPQKLRQLLHHLSDDVIMDSWLHPQLGGTAAAHIARTTRINPLIVPLVRSRLARHARSAPAFALRFYWLFRSFAEDYSTQYLDSNFERRRIEKELEAFLATLRRQGEAWNYVQAQTKLIDKLGKIGDELMLISSEDKPQRLKCLRKRLEGLNKLLDNEPNWCPYLPSYWTDEAPRRVVAFDTSTAICLSSRDRVPFLVWVETIQEQPEFCSQPTMMWHRGGADQSGEFRADTMVLQQASLTPRTKVIGEEGGVGLLDSVFGPVLEKQKEELRARSKHYALDPDSWNCHRLIVKVGDDMRQEQLAMQFIRVLKRIYESVSDGNESIKLLGRSIQPYDIIVTGNGSAFVSCVPEVVSLAQVKGSKNYANLLDFFCRAYGDGTAEVTLEEARTNFIYSMAAYSIITWLLNVGDRHNGNILLSRTGSVVHIDWGYFLMNHVGKNKLLGKTFGPVEQAPFKLTIEMAMVMGGPGSVGYTLFRNLFKEGIRVARANAAELIALVENLLPGDYLPCFQGDGHGAVAKLARRFLLYVDSDKEVDAILDQLVDSSYGSVWYDTYDLFQFKTNGIPV